MSSDTDMSNVNGSSDVTEEGFELLPPTGELAHIPDGDRPPLEMVPVPADMAKGPSMRDEDRARRMAWRGLEEPVRDDGGSEEPPVDFSPKGSLPQDDMDMTPMVDVVFLLLIFFMVTASFTLQQSIETPPAISQDPAMNVVDDPEQEEEYVDVIVDQNNSYFVTTRSQGEIEAPSEREMRERIKQAKADFGARRLVIRAHVDATHGRVVAVWDAGIAIGMDRIEIRVTEEDF